MAIKLFYYSATGNTRLASQYLQKRISGVKLFDISSADKREVTGEEIIGLATPVFYFKPPVIVSNFIDSLQADKVKIFMLVTYGMMPGRTTWILKNKIERKGYDLLGCHLLRMPESYPPFIAKGWTDCNAPRDNEITAFNSFITFLGGIMGQKKPVFENIKLPGRTDFLNKIIPVPSRKRIMKKFGEINVNTQRCNFCAVCVKACVYNAIRMDGLPKIDKEQCQACFSCINNCPLGALSTTNYSLTTTYFGPSESLKEKLL